MPVDSNAKGNAWAFMKVSTDSINPKSGLISIVSGRKEWRHLMMGVNFNETVGVGGAVGRIPWRDGRSGSDLVGNVEVPVPSIGEMEETFVGSLRSFPCRLGFFEHGRHECVRNDRHEESDGCFQGGYSVVPLMGDGKEDLELVSVRANEDAITGENDFIEIGAKGREGRTGDS